MRSETLMSFSAHYEACLLGSFQEKDKKVTQEESAF